MLAVELISKLIRYEGISGCEGLSDLISGKYVTEEDYKSIAIKLRSAYEHLDEFEKSISGLLELADEMDLRAKFESLESDLNRQIRNTRN